ESIANHIQDKMIGVLLLLMVLFENSFCLSEKGRIALTKAYGGMDIEKCHERLKKFGRKGWHRKTAPKTIPSVKEEANPAMEEDKNATNVELDPVLANGGSIEKVNQMEGVDEYLFDGDMILTEEQMAAYEKSMGKRTRKKRQISSNATRWDNNTVFYYFDGSITARNQAYIKTVLKYLSARTCIDFVENMTATNRVMVFNGAGCYATVGMDGGVQALSLAPDCMVVGTVAHEFMHTLGALHMHMRHDRDDYVKINLDSVPKNQVNFLKPMRSIIYTPYEYGSNMQYPSDAFTDNGESIIPLDGTYFRTLGSQTISFYDIRMINWHYRCNDSCASMASTTKCKNGGELNPRTCTTCICPFGYGGNSCEKRRAGCGRMPGATPKWKSRTITVGDATHDIVRDTYTMCNDWITAPPRKTIQIRVTELRNVECENGCWRSSIEPKVMADKAMISPRICCPGQLYRIITSRINPTPVVTYSIQLASTFTYQYRYV
ncbi:hypothetical protein V3C99_009765, partial [Haemonchus contortus]|uniref:Zinc metalloproteinase n=1 Tax=Haemonchus contortus TaxID=6289 RepID=A0A7I4YI42_HAECO